MKPGSEDEGSKQEAVSEATVEIVAAVVEVKEAMLTAVEMLEYLEWGHLELDKVAAVRFFGPLPPHSPGHLPGLLERLKDCMHMAYIIQSEAIISINRLIYHYARISEPTEMEMTSLEDAIDALDVFIKNSCSDHGHGPDSHHLSQVLPTIISIFQEPGKLKKAQIHAASCLVSLANRKYEMGELIDSRVMGTMMETVRVGKESPDVLTLTIFAISRSDLSFPEGLLNSGILEVIKEVFKRPNHALDNKEDIGAAWSSAMLCLHDLIGRSRDQVLDAILSSGGLMEHMLDMVDLDGMLKILTKIVDEGSESQLRQLMSKGSFFRFVACHLNTTSDDREWLDLMLDTVQACLAAPGTEEGLRLRHRLIDDSGITDAVQRISLSHDIYHEYVDQAGDIFDTYL